MRRVEWWSRMLVALALTKKLHLVQVNYRPYFCCEPVMNVLASLQFFYGCGCVQVCHSVKVSENPHLLTMCICVHQNMCVFTHRPQINLICQRAKHQGTVVPY